MVNCFKIAILAEIRTKKALFLLKNCKNDPVLAACPRPLAFGSWGLCPQTQLRAVGGFTPRSPMASGTWGLYFLNKNAMPYQVST